MDEELNRAIDRALDELSAVKPAPDFLPRLRAHVERAPVEAPIRWWVLFSASATAVVAGVIVASLFRAPQVERLARSEGPPAATAVPALAPNAAAAPGLTVTEQGAVRAASPVRQRRLRTVAVTVDADAVLVPSGQLAAIGRLLDAINAGDDRAASAVRKLGAGTVIEIAPIQIDPVIVPVIKAAKESSPW
jgi:hypothetical protein